LFNIVFLCFLGLIFDPHLPGQSKEHSTRAVLRSHGATASLLPRPTRRQADTARPLAAPFTTLAVGAVRIPANITDPRTMSDVAATSPAI
jgi:hypothetical protein